ncbi:MAG: hypothetical protein WCP97_00875 [bacterium]
MVDFVYQKFYDQYKPECYEQYLQNLSETIGVSYKFSSTPILISSEQWERLRETTTAVLDLLRSSEYQSSIAKQSWFLPVQPLTENDFYGCVDFHLGSDEEKIIEVNFFPPGFSSVAELMERTFIKHFQLPQKGLFEGFEELLISAITDNYSHSKVAVSDISIDQQYTLGEFYYLLKLMQQHGVDAQLCNAERVAISPDGYPVWHNQEFKRVYSRLIPYDWEYSKERLGCYTEMYTKHPEIFFTNPFGWRLADKRFLSVLSTLQDGDYGLDVVSVASIRRATLVTRMLQDFVDLQSVKDCFGSVKNIIVKPVDNFAGHGVLLKPTVGGLERLLSNDKARNNYVVQQLFPADKLRYITDAGKQEPMKYDVRVVFLRGNVVGAYGRVYEGSITNFRSEAGGFAPVLVYEK